MGILADHQIKDHVKIEPFADKCEKGVITYGLSSYGYDARVGHKFKVFNNTHCTVIDPKNFDDKAFVTIETTDYIDYIYIPPNSFALGESLETFTIPRDCLGVCVGKSTYARCGIIVNVTPLEPEWHGKVTIEISNTSPLPAKIYAGEGIMQVLFFRSDGYRAYTTAQLYQTLLKLSAGEVPESYRILEERFHRPYEEKSSDCRTSYADKKGRYQDQTGLTLPFVEKEG